MGNHEYHGKSWLGNAIIMAFGSSAHKDSIRNRKVNQAYETLGTLAYETTEDGRDHDLSSLQIIARHGLGGLIRVNRAKKVAEKANGGESLPIHQLYGQEFHERAKRLESRRYAQEVHDSNQDRGINPRENWSEMQEAYQSRLKEYTDLGYSTGDATNMVTEELFNSRKAHTRWAITNERDEAEARKYLQNGSKEIPKRLKLSDLFRMDD